ncbi:MAG TPA: hypothetical protein VNZ86_09235, partial [Bacteroidia bacterium]|nr:hypothetical protein [Bacteroidia bacterium]
MKSVKGIGTYLAWIAVAVIGYSCGQAAGNSAPAVKPPVRVLAKGSFSLDSSSLTPDERIKAARLDTLFMGKVKKTHFNGNVLIAHQGKVIYEKCFG